MAGDLDRNQESDRCIFYLVIYARSCSTGETGVGPVATLIYFGYVLSGLVPALNGRLFFQCEFLQALVLLLWVHKLMQKEKRREKRNGESWFVLI